VKVKRVAVIGCGSIGSEVVRAIEEGYVKAELVALYDIIKDKCVELTKQLRSQEPRVVSDLRELMTEKPEIVVEAASQDAVREYGEEVLRGGASLVVLSVGALMDPNTLNKLLKAAEEGNTYIYVPTGAIAALDAVRALRRVGFEKVTLRTRKPPTSLKLVGEPTKDLSKVREPTAVFRGKASEAVKKLPFNINVSAALSLASGTDAEVEVIADPNVRRNVHEIEVISKASRITVRVENVPSPRNPRTSYLATLSAIELLRKLTSPDRLIVGT